MKNKTLSGCVVGLSFAAALSSNALADISRFASTNYGYLESYYDLPNPTISVNSTNSVFQPYMGWIWLQTGRHGGPNPTGGLGRYQADGIVEFKISSLTDLSHYYLELSPTSTFSGNDLPSKVDIYWSQGDGLVTVADWQAGTLLGSVTITNPDDVNWYAPNGNGGYAGDSYFEISSLVNNAKAIGMEYLSFRYAPVAEIPDTGSLYSGVLLREPALLGGDLVVPAPAASALLALAGFVSRRRRV